MKVITPEQEALIPAYREKWQAIALSTEPIDREKAAAAVKAVYSVMGKKAPSIRFCSSPKEAIQLRLESETREETQIPVNFWARLFAQLCQIWKIIRWQQRLQNNSLQKLKLRLEKTAVKHIKRRVQLLLPPQNEKEEMAKLYLQISQIEANLDGENTQQSAAQEQEALRSLVSQFRWIPKIFIRSWIEGMLVLNVQKEILGVNWSIQGGEWTQFEHIERRLINQFARQVGMEYFQKYYPCFQPIASATTANWLEFYISVLNVTCDGKKWEAFESLVKECGWIFCFDRVCTVCDRPRILSVDGENRLHAEGEPAMQFADGYSLYAHHGVMLPEKYGEVHPDRWQAQWLLEEDNAEIRRVLIQGIGYARICQDLQAVVMDSFAEYTLLRIDSDVDVEPMHLLKMTCPSTGYIHAMRVPPNVRGAREAIKWVNWGVDPEDFRVQS